MEIPVVWRVGDVMGLVLDDGSHMTTMQGTVSPSLASLIEDLVKDWDMRPWNGDDDGWVAVRKEKANG